jgi:hypothetical protein
MQDLSPVLPEGGFPMSAAEKRMAWALVIGAVVTGFMAGDTNSWWVNWLVGIVPGFFAWLTAWILLEGVAWNVDAKAEAAAAARTQPSNVRRLPYADRGDEGMPQ